MMRERMLGGTEKHGRRTERRGGGDGPAMTLAEHVAAGRAILVTAGVDAALAALDAEMLARHLLGWDRASYLGRARDPAPAWFGEQYRGWLDRRAGREPVSQILGQREFWGLEFEVTRDVLTPRPETELVVEEALGCLSAMSAGGRTAHPIVDVGTGSGCLAISLAQEVSGAFVVATDTSPAALAVARRNARRHGVSARVAFCQASLVDAIAGPLSLVVSNPPYVPTADLATLPPEVRNFEPEMALSGGPDGLDVIRSLVDQVPRVLAPGGWLVFEFGAGQETGVRTVIARCQALGLVRVRGDLQGIPRTAVVRHMR
jgi:release factor glutamine methyltransferase